jgi:hypothetical protein
MTGPNISAERMAAVQAEAPEGSTPRIYMVPGHSKQASGADSSGEYK